MPRPDQLGAVHEKLDRLLAEVRELRAAMVPAGPVASLIGWEELKTIVPYSRNHIQRLEAAGKFPRRRQLGEGYRARVGWVRSEVAVWIASLPSKGTEPRHDDPPQAP